MKQQTQYLLRLLCLLLIAALGTAYQVRAQAWQHAAEENRAFRQKNAKEPDDRPPASYDISQMERQLWSDPAAFRKPE